VVVPVWPEGLDHIWAKSPGPGQPAGESLVRHTWEVLQRLADLARLRPSLPESVKQPRLWHLLAWAALLHDWGKLAPGFQARLRGGPPWPHRHEVLSLLWVDWVVEGLSEDESVWLAAAIVSHHRDAEELFLAYPLAVPPDEDPVRDLVAGINAGVVDALWAWRREIAPNWMGSLGLTTAGVRIPSAPAYPGAAAVLSEGVGRIRHWLRQYRRLVRGLEGAGVPTGLFLLRGHILQADHLASSGRQPIEPPDWTPAAILRNCNIDEARLYDHQRQVGGVDGSALLIAPTGSGKTEAALLWAAEQTRNPAGVPRFFYTLPYQASMNAMYDRLEVIFPGKVGLAHGRSVLALYQRLMEDDLSPQKATRHARESQVLARLHAHPVRVSSPFQMLKVAYQLKGYEAMLADYALGAFVFDEIHAYEPERLAMILETVRNLRERFGARFLVMSATLPHPVERMAQDALGGVSAVKPPARVFEAFARHRVHLVAGDMLTEEGVRRIVSSFGDGHSVLVACTTVGRAQQMYSILRARLPRERLVLLHGRFTGRDRLAKERAVMEMAGLHRNTRSVVLVATQVVEVSLNLDLDTVYSDPAPLEALVQRFGRVNRTRRKSLAPVHVFCEPADGQGVYDSGLIVSTLAVLREADGRLLDEGRVQEWLDRIYRDDVLARWENRYRRAATEFRQAFIATLRPFQSDPDAEVRFDRLFDGTEVLPKALVAEYQGLQEAEDPLGASQLLVPISWQRYRALRRAGRVQPVGKGLPSVVDMHYDEEVGLVF
jgi:CRISPR-associated endonuclease/helicase Cas3